MSAHLIRDSHAERPLCHSSSVNDVLQCHPPTLNPRMMQCQATTIDWNIKESVRARMKIMVKRLLRQYGYPPDMQALAIELVLEQAKVFTEFEVETRHS